MKKLRLEILKSTLELLENDLDDYHRGICYRFDLLYLEYTWKELQVFRKWFQTQKPHSKFHSKFTKHHSFTGGMWWWCRSKDGMEQRILFVKYLIERESK